LLAACAPEFAEAGGMDDDMDEIREDHVIILVEFAVRAARD
jgi:hypothetical protein